MKHTDPLTATTPTDAQRGTLTYMKPDHSYKTVEGWFYLNGGGVIMRKIGGRNHFNLCAAVDVYDFVAFDPHEAKFIKAMRIALARTKSD